MNRILFPALMLALAACDAEDAPSASAPPAPAGPWINSTDQAPLPDQLAGWKGKKVVLMEFSFVG